MNVEVRDAVIGDAPAIAALFYHTILNVNLGDYSAEQVEAWAGPGPDPGMWETRIAADNDLRRMFVAMEEERIVGFAELQADGHLDTLYVHHEFQGDVALCRGCLTGSRPRRGISVSFASTRRRASPQNSSSGPEDSPS